MTQPTETSTPAAADVLSDVSALVPLLLEHAPEGERLTRLAPPVVEALDKAGVFRSAMPRVLGGFEFSVREQTEIFAEVARGDGSAGWVAVTTAAIPPFCTAFPQQAIEEIKSVKAVGPVAAGSIFTPGQGTARRVDGGWMVAGAWKYCSGVQLSAWLLGGVEIHDERTEKTGAMVLLSRDQYRIKDDWRVAGLAATNTNTAFIDEEVFVPEHRLISREEVDRHIMRGQAGYPAAAAVGPLFGSLAVGMARGAFDAFLAQSGKGRPGTPGLASLPTTQIAVGRVETMIEAARAAVLAEADRVDRMGNGGEPLASESMNRLLLVAAYVARQCSDAVDLLMCTLGAGAAFTSNPVQRFMRDVHVLNLHGTMRLDTRALSRGAHLLGQPAHRDPSLPF